MSLAWRQVLALSIVMVNCTLVLAQETPPTAEAPSDKSTGELATLQGKNAITDEERGAIRTWIAKHVETVANQADQNKDALIAGAKAVAELRAEFRGTQAFKEAFSAIAVEVIAPLYKAAKRTPATQLVSVLGSLDEMAAAKPLIEALGDERPSVRAAAASGLRALRPKLAAAGAGAVNDAVDALREAGKKETSQIGLKSIFAAMNYAEGVTAPDPKHVAVALLEVLETRSEQYVARNVKAEGADVVGLATLGLMKASLTDAERDRMVIVSARMLTYATQRYRSELHEVQDKRSSEAQIEARNHAELLIAEAEKQLREILKPAAPEPGVARVMHEAEKPGKEGERAFNMGLEFAKWSALLLTRTNQKFELDDAEPAAKP